MFHKVFLFLYIKKNITFFEEVNAIVTEDLVVKILKKRKKNFLRKESEVIK